jgi:hypothetical protein
LGEQYHFIVILSNCITPISLNRNQASINMNDY